VAARSEPSRRIRGHGGAGFTLLEILVALGVISVASWILISLFTSSLFFANSARTHRAAVGLAEEQLDRLVRHPEQFEGWPAEPGQAPLKLKGTDAEAPYPVDAPSVKTLDPASGRREQSFYEAFTWQPFAVLPNPEAKHLEVVAVVRWSIEGKDYSFSLTSAVPRALVEGRS